MVSIIRCHFFLIDKSKNKKLAKKEVQIYYLSSKLKSTKKRSMKGYCTEVKQFSDACQNNGNPTTPELMSTKAIAFIREMVNDELDELEEAVNTHEQADALVDAIYYICDTAVRHGLNLDPLFSIVHRANMQKLVDGNVIRREDGKIMKPEGWQDPEPFLSTEMKRQETEGSW